jgi:hypothetical protein
MSSFTSTLPVPGVTYHTDRHKGSLLARVFVLRIADHGRADPGG